MKRERDYKKCDLYIDDVIPFDGPVHSGVEIRWSCYEIGFGGYMLYRDNADEKLYGYSECMDTNESKTFLAALLDLVKDRVLQEVIIEG